MLTSRAVFTRKGHEGALRDAGGNALYLDLGNGSTAVYIRHIHGAVHVKSCALNV